MKKTPRQLQVTGMKRIIVSIPYLCTKACKWLTFTNAHGDNKFKVFV